MKWVLLVCSLFILFPANVFAYDRKATPIFHVHNVQQKLIAFTFDDGPDPMNTAELLNVLQQEKVKATFFVLGKRAKRYPRLLRRMAKEGHEIGSHGYSHSQFRKLTAKQISWELKSTEQIIVKATGKKPSCFRSPYGQLTTAIKQVSYHHNYKLIEWSIDPRDWDGKKSFSIQQSVEPYIHAGDIVLFHDGGKNGKETTKAVRQLIRHLKAKGYNFVTVSELSK